ncbi:MAG: hypothetical protein QM755_03220 [Luteolibacter sp.]
MTTTRVGDRPTRGDSHVSPDAAVKFRRFFLPPIQMENLTIAQAVEKVLLTYRQVCEDTREEALPLQVGLQEAATARTINVTTPRAPVGTVLRFIASLSTNKLNGKLPDFHLRGLSIEPDRRGTLDVPPDLFALLSNRAQRDPFETAEATGTHEENLQDFLVQAGFSPSLTCSVKGATLTYQNFSEADLERLKAMMEVSDGGGFGPLQVQSGIRVLEISSKDLAEKWTQNATLTTADIDLLMLASLKTQDADLLTLPSFTARNGQSASAEVVQDAQDHQGAATWTGVRVSAITEPYGPGSTTSFHSQHKAKPDDEPVSVQLQSRYVPDGGGAIGYSRTADGKTIVTIQTVNQIDATGRRLPITAQEAEN